MNKHNLFISLLLTTALLLCVGNAVCEDDYSTAVSLSVPNIQLKENDRIVGFKLKIKRGFVISVPKIPVGWFLDIDLPSQSETDIKAGSIVGVADLVGKERDYFNDFLIIEPDSLEQLEITVEITVDKSLEEDKEETLFFDMKKLRLKKVDSRATK